MYIQPVPAAVQMQPERPLAKAPRPRSSPVPHLVARDRTQHTPSRASSKRQRNALPRQRPAAGCRSHWRPRALPSCARVPSPSEPIVFNDGSFGMVADQRQQQHYRGNHDRHAQHFVQSAAPGGCHFQSQRPHASEALLMRAARCATDTVADHTMILTREQRAKANKTPGANPREQPTCCTRLPMLQEAARER